MGLVKYTPQGWAQVAEYLNNFSQDELDKLDMTTLLQGIIDSGVVVNTVPIQDKWFEVDSETDLRSYESNFKTSPIR